MYKKHILIPIIALIYLSLLTSSSSLIFAASPTPSLSPSPSPMASPSEKDAIENAKKRILARGDDENLIPTSSARAYIGIVKDVIKDTVIIEDKSGKKDIKLTADTTILRTPGNKEIKSDSIRIDDYIIAIGYPGEVDVLTGRRLIVSTNPIKAPAKNSDIGTISKITKTGLILKIGDKDETIFTNTKTIYKSTSESIEATDLKIGDTVIFTATVDDNKERTATILMRTKTSLQ